MKAVFVLQTDPFYPKPALRAVREAETLRDAGWDVSFVAWTKSEAPPAEVESPLRVQRVRAPVPPLGSGLLRRGLAFLRATRELSDAAAVERPDFVVAHDFEVLRAAVAAKRRARAPLVYDSHEDWPALIAENSAREAAIAKIQERRLSRHADHILTVSGPIARKFREWGRPTTVLYSSRPSAEIRLADRRESRNRMGYGAEDFVVGFAGALGSGRGLEHLIDALPDTPPRVHALIIGGPDEEATRLKVRAAEAGLAPRVRIEGYRPFKELGPFYAAMDVGTILLDDRPNHRRALPNKLFDYMAHGLPVLVPEFPAMAEIVRATGCGWTIPGITPALIRDALEGAVRAPDREAMGARGRAAFETRFAWERQAPVFLEIVESLARRM